jgi:hypothetical protein
MVTAPLCAACLLHGRGVEPAAEFVRDREWDSTAQGFAEAGVRPLCRACFDRRWEMVQGSNMGQIPWDDGMKEWELQRVHES